MIPESVRTTLDQLGSRARRDPADQGRVTKCLEELSVAQHEQLKEFFSQYKLSGVLSEQPVELLDLASPSEHIAEATEFARDSYDLTNDYICLSSGEGEGFILYSKKDRKVYDISVSELDALEEGVVRARWESFYDLLEWYLT